MSSSESCHTLRNEDNKDELKGSPENYLTDKSSIKTDFTIESESGVQSPDYSSSFDSESTTSRISMPQSRRFLRRNKSSAAECVSVRHNGNTHSSKHSDSDINGTNNWYGTW